MRNAPARLHRNQGRQKWLAGLGLKIDILIIGLASFLGYLIASHLMKVF